MNQVILASASPRRKELLKKAGIKFRVVESKIEEDFNSELNPSKLAEKLSLEKAKAVYRKNPLRQLADGGKNSIIIAADTLVVCEGKIIGKPKDENEAKEMLKFLTGKMHKVITGFTIYDPESKKFITKSAESKLYFNHVSDKEIIDYVDLKKPLDKAGAYGIQELPKTFISKVEGDYDNIVGLPTKEILRQLRQLGIKPSN